MTKVKDLCKPFYKMIIIRVFLSYQTYVLWAKKKRPPRRFFHAHNTVVFMPPKELWEAYSNRTVRPSVPLRVRCISPIFFEVGIPNLVCGCILGWRSVAYHFRVTVTLALTSDLVFIVVTMSVCPSRFLYGAYLLYSLR